MSLGYLDNKEATKLSKFYDAKEERWYHRTGDAGAFRTVHQPGTELLWYCGRIADIISVESSSVCSCPHAPATFSSSFVQGTLEVPAVCLENILQSSIHLRTACVGGPAANDISVVVPASVSLSANLQKRVRDAVCASEYSACAPNLSLVSFPGELPVDLRYVAFGHGRSFIVF